MLGRSGYIFQAAYNPQNPLPTTGSDIEALDDLDQHVLINLDPSEQAPVNFRVTYESGPYNELSTDLWLHPFSGVRLTYSAVRDIIHEILALFVDEWTAGAGFAAEILIRDRRNTKLMSIKYDVLPINRIDVPTSGAITLQGYFYPTRELPLDLVTSTLNSGISATASDIQKDGNTIPQSNELRTYDHRGLRLEYFLTKSEDGIWPVVHKSDISAALEAIKTFFAMRRRASLASFDVNVKQGSNDLICGYIHLVDKRTHVQGTASPSNATDIPTSGPSLTLSGLSRPLGSVVAVN